jgi:hypothetical protein
MKTHGFAFSMAVTNLILMICIAARPPKENFDKITVKEFEMVDDKGNMRASIKAESNGEVVFRLKDKRGIIRVKIGASEDGSALVLLDKNTNPGVFVMAKRDTSSITITNKDGKRREY